MMNLFKKKKKPTEVWPVYDFGVGDEVCCDFINGSKTGHISSKSFTGSSVLGRPMTKFMVTFEKEDKKHEEAVWATIITKIER
jgi:hypothetical protein